MNSRQEIEKKTENNKFETEKGKEKEILSKKSLNLEEKVLSARSQDFKIPSEKKSKSSMSSLNELREGDKSERKSERSILNEYKFLSF